MIYHFLYSQKIKFQAFIFCIAFPLILSADKRTPYYDGPYIFDSGDSIRVQWVEKGYGFDTLIAKIDAGVFQYDSLPVVDLTSLDFEVNLTAEYTDVDSIICISDIHGQYDLMLKLLTNQGVVDKNGSWTFGTGHLMVVGDNFDRGDKVLDILWFLFNLQKEAASHGGKVHVLLGNHETMVLNGDFRYLNRKYYYTSALFGIPYDRFFREGSVLGDWITSHNVVTSINNNLFVHGGISPAVIRLDYSLDTINQIYKEHLVRMDESSVFMDSTHEILYLNDGPLWYRGYFDTSDVAIDSVNYVLNRIQYDKIIIGHTSKDSITALYGNKILDIDCSIKLGNGGQVLFIDSSEYYVASLDGTRTAIPPPPKVEKKGFYDFIYNIPGRPHITIKTDVGRMKGKSKKEEYQPASFTLADSSGAILYSLDGKLRARGNMRKQVCRIPPVKFDFSKSDLDSIGFLKLDKLKLLFPCRDRDTEQEHLYKEILLYGLYNFIDSNSIRVKLVDFTLIKEDGKVEYEFVGAIVEDEDAYALRKDAKIVESGKVRDGALDRDPFLKMDFFQYMIANCDWSLSNKHNLEIVKLPDRARVVALPYDFDYSGFVGTRYAVPHESLPISSVHERYFFSYKITEDEYYQMVDYYLSIEDDLYRICDEATYLKPKTIEKCKEYLGTYFKLLRKPEKLKKKMVRN